MFSNLVTEQVNRLALEYTIDKNGLGHQHSTEFYTHMQQQLGPMAKFFLGDLFRIGFEPIYEFVQFFCMADYIQQQNNESTSILKYAENIFDDKLNENLPAEIVEADKRNFYERKIEHYHSLNAEKKIEYERILAQERQDRERKRMDNETIKGNANRYKGNQLFEFQFNEFDILDAIKEGEHDSVKANKTYKRIVSEKGYLNLMSFKELQKFVGVLKNEIDESDELHTNIRYYKLERRMHFELVKCVLTAINQCEEAMEIEEKVYLYDLCWLFHLPLLKARQTYAEIYPKLTKKEFHAWREEVFNLIIFLQRAVLSVQNQIKGKEEHVYTDCDWERFNTIYTPKSFQNNNKQRKDFQAQHFTKLMKYLDQHNTAAMEQLKAAINHTFSS